MKINIVSKKLIKPCTPTPNNLKNYNLSFIDETIGRHYVGVLLFYSSKPKQIRQLEESLSTILPQFYPFAGRYVKKHNLVDCSDQGAEFIQAEALDDVELIDVVEAKITEQLKVLLPRQYNQVDAAATDPLLSIQITEFKCGGLVIGVSVCHKFFDASSIGTFVAAWSNASNNPEGKFTIIPTFDFSSLLPCKNQWDPELPPISFNNIVVKRFSFNKDAIMSLKSKLRPHGEGVISRVRVVCAVIAKALIGADLVKYGQPRACIINQTVNMRERTIPPLPKHSCGNLVLQSLSRCIAATETEGIAVEELVRILGDAINKAVNDCAQIFSLGEDGQNKIVLNPLATFYEKAKSGEVNVMCFSDWSKFGFYEADFGWGKPVWAGMDTFAWERLTVLMNNIEGDGIEAWVCLNHEDMPCFEQDDHIKFFTT